MDFIRRLKKRWSQHYYRELFAWHSEKFFPLNRYLDREDLEYIEFCFTLVRDYVPDELVERHLPLKAISYSHHVQGIEVNSARMLCGLATFSAELWEVAQKAISTHGVDLDKDLHELGASQFFALGWDLLSATFDVYLRVNLDAQTHTSWLNDTRWQGIGNKYLTRYQYRAEAILRHSYRSGQLWAEMLYVIPQHTDKDTEKIQGVRRIVWILSPQLGIFTKCDVSDDSKWKSLLNPQGLRIIQNYQRFGEKLDAIEFRDANHFTLYFP